MFQDLLKFKSSYNLYLIPYCTKDVLSWRFQMNIANEMENFSISNQMMKPGKKAKALKLEWEKLRNTFRHTTNYIGNWTAAKRLSLKLPRDTRPHSEFCWLFWFLSVSFSSCGGWADVNALLGEWTIVEMEFPAS